jgi:hypothetical protein
MPAKVCFPRCRRSSEMSEEFWGMSVEGQSVQGRPNGKSGRVRCATESGRKLLALAALRPVIAP